VSPHEHRIAVQRAALAWRIAGSQVEQMEHAPEGAPSCLRCTAIAISIRTGEELAAAVDAWIASDPVATALVTGALGLAEARA